MSNDSFEMKQINEIFWKEKIVALTRIFGISNRPFLSLEPGGNGRPPGRVHATLARNGPSSRHWNTTSKPKKSFSINQFDILIFLFYPMNAFMHVFGYNMYNFYFSFRNLNASISNVFVVCRKIQKSLGHACFSNLIDFFLL